MVSINYYSCSTETVHVHVDETTSRANDVFDEGDFYGFSSSDVSANEDAQSYEFVSITSEPVYVSA